MLAIPVGTLALTFFDQLTDVLKEVPPQQGEEALYAQINGLLDAISRNPKLKECLIIDFVFASIE